MRKKHLPEDFACPVETTVAVVGGRWKAPILHHLLRADGVLRFGEFRRLLPGTTQQMLTNQLRELEADGVVHREVYRQVPPKVEYSLTPLGQSLGPVIEVMCKWGEGYERRLRATAAATSAPRRGTARAARR